ncbi:MAG TPA: hypothetical protein VIL93_02860 [Solirubrobacterales bacterium]
MPARAKLTDEQVKRIRRRVRAGECLTDLAPEYDVNRKTIRRRLDAAAIADAERGACSAKSGPGGLLAENCGVKLDLELA